MADRSEFLEASLHMWRAIEDPAYPAGYLSTKPALPTELCDDSPTLVILPGSEANHFLGSNVANLLGRPIGFGIKSLGGTSLISTGKIRSYIVTWPLKESCSSLYEERWAPSLGPRENPYCPYTSDLAEALMDEVPDYSTLSSSEQRQAVDALHHRLRTKVFVGVSRGSLVADELANALVDQLQQRHYPPAIIRDEILPALKCVTCANRGLYARRDDRVDTGATALHLVNTRDEIARAYALSSEHDTAVKQLMENYEDVTDGTSIARTGRREISAAITLPINSYDVLTPASQLAEEDNEDVEGENKQFVDAEFHNGQMVARISRDDITMDGHNPAMFTQVIIPHPPREGHEPQTGLSNLHVTGHFYGNVLRHMMQDAIEEAGHTGPRRPMLDVADMLRAPMPMLTHQGSPETDWTFRRVRAADIAAFLEPYQPHLEGIHSIAELVSGACHIATAPLYQDRIRRQGHGNSPGGL